MVARLLGGEEGSAPDMDPAIMGQALDVLKDFLKNMDDILLEKASYQSVFDLSQTGSRLFFYLFR